MRVWLDKIASSTMNVRLKRRARLSGEVVAREGYVVAGRVRGEKTVYNQLEDVHGRMVRLHDGDVVAGVLGRRNALQGYAGRVPERVAPGDVLQLLNLGGVIGACTSRNPELGEPFDVEILGSVLVFPEFDSRNGVPAHIGMNAVLDGDSSGRIAPVVYVAGTCMNAGKTVAACTLVRQLARRGLAVGACKLTGVALRRDTLQMHDYGAQWALNFTDAGIVCTTADNAVPVATTLLRRLTESGASVIVAELGDGLLGEYGVAQILSEPRLTAAAAAIVLCANDPVGAWGAQRVMRERFNLSLDVISGPTTDNRVGTQAIERQLDIRAINARTDGEALGALIAERVSPFPSDRSAQPTVAARAAPAHDS